MVESSRRTPAVPSRRRSRPHPAASDPSTPLPDARRGRTATAVGLGVALLLIAVAIALPPILDWEVFSRAPRSASDRALPPLHGLWEPTWGIGTIPAIVLAFLGWRFGPGLASRLGWGRLLALSYAVALAWLLALALVDGAEGLSRQLGNPYEYLRTAREVEDVGALVLEYLSRVPYSADDNWVTHVAGHPPGTLMIFVGLVQLGLGSDLAAGVVVTVAAAALPLAVLVTLRALGAEAMARRATPFLVLSPAAIFLAVSADALIALVGAWGIAFLALGATRASRAAAIGFSALAGTLLGYAVLMSYGMPLYGLLAVAVLIAARSWLPLPVALVTASAVGLGFAAAGFALWEAFPVISERYWDGIAKDRPFAYWGWANLAALTISTGPLLGAGLARTAALRGRPDRIVLLLAGAAVAMIVAADLSGMSKAEVERIWLPFIPWLTISMALLSDRWLRAGLAIQLVWALAVQHLLYTVW